MSPTRFRCANSLEGLVPDKNFRMRNAQRERQKDTLIGVGFEPTPPKRLVPKTSALDRSAIQPKIQCHRVWHTENGHVH